MAWLLVWTSPVVTMRARDAAATGTAADLRQRGLELGYNLDYSEALAVFRAAEALAPDDPAAYRLAAATIWMRLLFSQGAITVDDYLGETRSDVERAAPDPDAVAAFHREIDRAVELSEVELAAHPQAADAHFQVGAAYGVIASYTATVEGRIAGSLGPARRAYREHQRVLEMDPRRLDAGLIVGLYRCAVADLSWPMRWAAHVAGFAGDREEGLRLVEEAAESHGDGETSAEFMRILLYSRAGRFDDARLVTHALQTRYPRNRLLWLEDGLAALKAGRPDQANAAIATGLVRVAAETRPLAPGELARWRLAHGMALVALHELDTADRELHLALAGSTRGWVEGRVHRELGKVADLRGDRRGALDEYRTADARCRAGHDIECVASVKTLVASAYR